MKDTKKGIEINQNRKMNYLFNKKKTKQAILDVAFILFVISILYRFVLMLFSPYAYKDWQVSEFLINYQSGFVRRGLMGEILFFFAKNFNINIEWTVKIFCTICFMVCCIFFVKLFQKKHYSLYILPLCFFLSGVVLSNDWIRKDYLFFCFFIPILWFYSNQHVSLTIKLIAINILSVFIILSHEVFTFFALPVLFLLFFDRYKNTGIIRSFIFSSLCLFPSIFAFLLTLYFHGNPDTAQTIWESWTGLFNQAASDVGKSVNAIGWTSGDTFLFHFNHNFLSHNQGVFSSVVWIIILPVVYYISTNVLLVFRGKSDFCDRHKTVLSSVLIFQFLCLSPVFLVLSCDYVRVIFYWVASSFAIFLLIPMATIETLTPCTFRTFVERINQKLTNFVQPTKTVLTVFMLFIGIANYSFIEITYQSTMIYNILLVISKPFILLTNNLMGFI